MTKLEENFEAIVDWLQKSYQAEGDKKDAETLT